MPKALNKLPADANWLRAVERVCNEGAAELDCALILVAIQTDQKMVMYDAGGTGHVRELLDRKKASDVFFALAHACLLAEAMDAKEEAEATRN